MNEIHFYSLGDPSWRRRYKTNYSGPIDRYLAELHPNHGLALGYGDKKTIELRKLVEAIGTNGSIPNDFHFASRVTRLVECVRASERERRWVSIGEVA